MSTTTTYKQILRPRNIIQTIQRFKKYRASCERDYECSCPKPPLPKLPFSVEPTCQPCYFLNWKPEIPDLKKRMEEEKNLHDDEPWAKQEECTPGMKIKHIDRCKLKKDSQECIEKNDPKHVGEKCVLSKPPEEKKEVVKKHEIIPPADWDFDAKC